MYENILMLLFLNRDGAACTHAPKILNANDSLKWMAWYFIHSAPNLGNALCGINDDVRGWFEPVAWVF